MHISRVRSKGRRSADPVKKTSGLDLQCVGDCNDVQQTDVAFSALNAPDIGAVQAAAIREFLLRELQFFSVSPNAPAKNRSRIVNCHESTVAVLHP